MEALSDETREEEGGPLAARQFRDPHDATNGPTQDLPFEAARLAPEWWNDDWEDALSNVLTALQVSRRSANEERAARDPASGNGPAVRAPAPESVADDGSPTRMALNLPPPFAEGPPSAGASWDTATRVADDAVAFYSGASEGGASPAGSSSSATSSDDTTRHVTFFGRVPPLGVGNSVGRLALRENVETSQVFRWQSTDTVLGTVDTRFVTAAIWNHIPGTPDRLVFVGGGEGVAIYGNVLFEPYTRGVVDVVRGEQRVRYLLDEIGCEQVHLPGDFSVDSRGEDVRDTSQEWVATKYYYIDIPFPPSTVSGESFSTSVNVDRYIPGVTDRGQPTLSSIANGIISPTARLRVCARVLSDEPGVPFRFNDTSTDIGERPLVLTSRRGRATVSTFHLNARDLMLATAPGTGGAGPCRPSIRSSSTGGPVSRQLRDHLGGACSVENLESVSRITASNLV